MFKCQSQVLFCHAIGWPFLEFSATKQALLMQQKDLKSLIFLFLNPISLLKSRINPAQDEIPESVCRAVFILNFKKCRHHHQRGLNLEKKLNMAPVFNLINDLI